MRKIVRTLAVLSVGTMMIVPTAPAQAALERHELACTAYFVSFDTSDAREWEAGNTWHGRNGIETNRTEGSPYCAGMEIVGNGNGNGGLVGTYWGRFRFELEAFPGSGFEGRWQMQFVYPNLGEGDEVGTGYGVFEGWQIRTTFQINLEQEEETDPYYWVWGYVFNPAG